MAPTDSVFLLAESREHPMHVGGLSLFEPPEGAGPEFVREFTDAMVANDEFQPTFRKRPATIMGGIAPLAWAYDDNDDIDVDYHVRRSALASPGRVRELLELTSRLHTSLLDRHRPLWELYVVEGLNDGRFAMYSKMHHALIDGVSAMKLMQRTLSVDPDDTEVRAMWSLPRRPRPQVGGFVPVGLAGQFGGIRCGTCPVDGEAGPRGAVRAAVDPAVGGSAHHVQRQDRGRAPVCRSVLVGGSRHEASRRPPG